MSQTLTSTPATSPAAPPPPPAAAVAAGAPAPAVGVPQEGADDITITSTSDTPEQVAAALRHTVPDAPVDQAAVDAAKAAETARAAAAVATDEDEAEDAAVTTAGKVLSGKKRSLQRRLDETVYEREENRRAAERATADAVAHATESARLKAENDALRAGKPVPGTQPVAVEAPKKPELKDFADQPDPYQAYTDAVSTWTADRAVEKVRAELNGTLSTRDRAEQTRQAQIAAQTTQDRDFATHKARVETFRAGTPDYDQVVSDAMKAIVDSPEGIFPIPPALADHVQYTETGPALFYHLAQDQAEFRRIAGIKQQGPLLVALGRYEAKLESQGKLTPKGTSATPVAAADPATRARDALTSSSTPAVAVTKAPPPPSLVGSGTTASTVPLEELDYQAYKAQRNAHERARRR